MNEITLSAKAVLRLQEAMLDLPDERKFEPETLHHFAPGQYAREMHLPAGHFVVGKRHKHGHLNTLSQGKVLLVNEQGRYELSAPFTFTSQPGTKRAIYALEDAVWTTYHLNPTDTRDFAELEALHIIPEDV